MTNKYLSISIEPERLVGYLLKAIAKNEKLDISISQNDGESTNAPQFKNNNLGVSVWERESRF